MFQIGNRICSSIEQYIETIPYKCLSYDFNESIDENDPMAAFFMPRSHQVSCVLTINMMIRYCNQNKGFNICKDNDIVEIYEILSLYVSNLRNELKEDNNKDKEIKIKQVLHTLSLLHKNIVRICRTNSNERAQRIANQNKLFHLIGG